MRKNTQETFTIPSDIVKQLDDYSKKSLIPKSRLIANLLKNFFKKNG
jgi:hypothetical protein